MDKLAEILEWLFYPLLHWLDRTGIAGNLRFGPLYKMAAAITAVVIVAYIISLILKPVNKNLTRLRKVRYLGRIVTIGIAVMMTYNIMTETGFIVKRGSQTSRVLGSNFGYILVLALILFLEIRLYRKNESNQNN